MSALDFNTADAPRAMGELIPANTPAMVVLSLRPGGHGDGGWLKNTKAGDGLMLDVEFTIDGGPHSRRKFWGTYVVEGNGSDGHNKAVSISRSTVRGILESARNINPADESEAAMVGRRLSGWGDIDGLRFPCRIGVEKGGLKDKAAGPTSERFADKNILSIAIPPGDKDYVDPGPQQARAAAPQGGFAAPAAQAAAPVAKPSWAA